jgi:hypothetical protein
MLQSDGNHADEGLISSLEYDPYTPIDFTLCRRNLDFSPFHLRNICWQSGTVIWFINYAEWRSKKLISLITFIWNNLIGCHFQLDFYFVETRIVFPLILNQYTLGNKVWNDNTCIHNAMDRTQIKCKLTAWYVNGWYYTTEIRDV